jgi:hypothetical protein
MSRLPSVSVVINTLNRASSLRGTLDSFRWQTYRGAFEIIVVNGPSTDATDQVIADWQPKIRAGTCPTANLSMSRNIGICMAQGDIVAFIDDDGIPEPEWLAQIAAAYDQPDVGAAGGLVFDHTGYDFQARFCMVDRFANADDSAPGPMPHRSFPGSFQFPHLLGTNSTFLRKALLGIGGFDEEFDYYLDETDLCARLIDAGYVIRQLPNAYVHHKFAASNIRSTKRVLKHRYSVLKNKVYFTLKHARDYVPLERVFEEQARFIATQRADVKWCLDNDLLTKADAQAFEQDVGKALAVGRARGLAGPGEMITAEKLSRYAGAFSPFPTLRTDRPLTVVLVSQDYPPDHGGGIATFNKDLATGLAALGHIVLVVSQSRDIDRVDVEDGVWVHRILIRDIPPSPSAIPYAVPSHIWNWTATALDEVRRIATHRPIDVVEAPIWDCQGAAFLLDGDWPLVTSLQTSLHFFLESHPELKADASWMASFGTPMLRLEQQIMQQSNAVRSISRAIKLDIEQAYGFRFDEGQAVVAPLGLAAHTAHHAAEEGTTVLFVGRLEHRKGIDVLLAAVPLVLAEEPTVRFRIIGDTSLPGPDGKTTYQAGFTASPAGRKFRASVQFDGKVDDEALQAAYASCSLFVAPSRYESFGLIFLEAMREGKPVIGCSIGGMPEIIGQDETGLLVPPGDADALAQAILRLVRSPDMRARLGRRGREVFEARFTAAHMAGQSVELYLLAKRRPPFVWPTKIAYVNGVCVKYDAISTAVRDEVLALRANGFRNVHLFTHACDYPDVPHRVVAAPFDVAADRRFQDAELVVFHFGIYYPLFDLLGCLPRTVKRLVVFHNLTSRGVLSSDHHELMDRSLAQMRLIARADHVICDSETNLQTLRAAGIDIPATVLPLAVHLAPTPPAGKPSFADGIVRLAFVGRFVQAKGPLDLLAAVAQLGASVPDAQVRLDMVGNVAFSDRQVLAEMKRAALGAEASWRGRLRVAIHGDASDETKQDLLRAADIFALPTYHEGFCVPILEAFASGCQVVVYDNSNTPAICHGLASLVATGDVAGFGRALADGLAKARSAEWRDGGYAAHAGTTGAYVRQFLPEVVEQRFVSFIRRFLEAETP